VKCTRISSLLLLNAARSGKIPGFSGGSVRAASFARQAKDVVCGGLSVTAGAQAEPAAGKNAAVGVELEEAPTSAGLAHAVAVPVARVGKLCDHAAVRKRGIDHERAVTGAAFRADSHVDLLLGLMTARSERSSVHRRPALHVRVGVPGRCWRRRGSLDFGGLRQCIRRTCQRSFDRVRARDARGETKSRACAHSKKSESCAHRRSMVPRQRVVQGP
jgi:hypothetical protein